MHRQDTRTVVNCAEPMQEAVIMHYQATALQMTQSFLSTQQSVMLCYLQSIQRQQQQHSYAFIKAEQPIRTSSIPSLPSASESVHSSMPIPLPAQSAMLRPNIAWTHPAAVESLAISTAQPNSAVSSAQSAGLVVSAEDVPETLGALHSDHKTYLDDEGLMAALTQLISERTGYPVEMLEPTLDLESDLGIDSIKRIEILSKFQSFLPEDKKALLQDSIEQLAAARTLNQVFDWIKNPQPETVPDATAV